MKRTLLFFLFVVLAGCASRHVVLAPEDVDRLNEKGWTVHSPPRIVVAAPDAAPPP